MVFAIIGIIVLIVLLLVLIYAINVILAGVTPLLALGIAVAIVFWLVQKTKLGQKLLKK